MQYLPPLPLFFNVMAVESLRGWTNRRSGRCLRTAWRVWMSMGDWCGGLWLNGGSSVTCRERGETMPKEETRSIFEELYPWNDFLWWYIDENGSQNCNTNSVVVLPQIEPATSCAVLGASAMPKYLFNFERSKFLYYVIYWRVDHRIRGLKSLQKYVKTNYLLS